LLRCYWQASNWIAARIFQGQIHGSAIAITLGLLLAYWGGRSSGGSNGLADVSFFSGLGILGGAMFRDFAIVATAFGAELDALKRAGWVGVMSVVLGVVLSFVVGAVVAVAFGFSDAVSISTIGAGRGDVHCRAGNGHRARGQAPVLLP
jgi:malonate transporter MadM subunit